MSAILAEDLRFIYAGDRRISVDILEFLLSQGARPQALMVPDDTLASHSAELIALCTHLGKDHIWRGKSFQEPHNVERMRNLAPQYIFGIHFPLIIPRVVLNLPTVGVLNLHPAFLPYNRGWHNSAWALLENTPYGGTLHFMNEGVDTGDIVHQKRVTVMPDDTGNSLYQKALRTEVETFIEAWPLLLSGHPPRTAQDGSVGTAHKKRDLAASGVQRLDLDETTTGRALLDRLRALTTNSPAEAAYFEENGVRYRIRVTIEKAT
jgi:methionyl-tRNA formyltransferase